MAGVMIDDLIRLASEEFRFGSCKFFQSLAVWPITDNYQPPVQPLACFDGQIDSLVRRQTRQHQVVIVDLIRWLKSFGIDRRWNNKSLATVNLLDALGNQV